MRFFAVALALLAVPAFAATTIDPGGVANKYAFGANIGWIDLAADGTSGVVVGQYAAGGYGWATTIRARG